MQRAASMLSKHLITLGMKNVQIFPTAGHPIIYGEWLNGPEGCPTMHVYGHYDVQPSEPDDLWISKPFEPTIRAKIFLLAGLRI